MNATTFRLYFLNFTKEHGLTNANGELTERGFEYVQAEIRKLPYKFDQCVMHSFDVIELCSSERKIVYCANTILEDRFAQRGATRYVDATKPLSVSALALDCKLCPGRETAMLVIGIDMSLLLDVSSANVTALKPGVSVCEIVISLDAEVTSL